MSEPKGMKEHGWHEGRKPESPLREMKQMRRDFLEGLATALGVTPSRAAENAKLVSLKSDIDTLWNKFEHKGDERGGKGVLENGDVEAIKKIGKMLTEGTHLKKKEDEFSVGLHALMLFKKEPSPWLFERVKEKLIEWGAEPGARDKFDRIAAGRKLKQ